MRIPGELLKQISTGNLLLFLGEEISWGAAGEKGLPTGGELARELARLCDYPGADDSSLPDVAGYFAGERDRAALVRFLQERIGQAQVAPLRAHRLIAKLPIRIILTTCYDELLEAQFHHERRRYAGVIGNQDIPFLDESKTVLVKLRGSIGQPESLVITRSDHKRLAAERDLVSTFVKSHLASGTILLAGHDLDRDELFMDLHDQLVKDLDRYARRSYAVSSRPVRVSRREWERRNVELFEADVTGFLQDLHTACAEQGLQVPELWGIPAPVITVPERPYKLLNYYSPEDEAIFFGRREEARQLLSLIEAYRFVLLYGQSGSGKTSLINAGLIPPLRRRGYEAIRVRVPGGPLPAIGRELAPLLPEPPNAESLLALLRRATESLGRPLVVFLDQFEEFFIHLGAATRADFIAQLAGACEDRDLRVKFVVSMREDFLAGMSELEPHIPAVFVNKSRLQRLDREAARLSIVGPVERLGLAYEPALVERLLDDLDREGIEPPQLQIVCDTLYSQLGEGERVITLAVHQALGGTKEILTGYLGDVLRRLPPERRELARAVLKELVTSLQTRELLDVTELAGRVGEARGEIEAILGQLVEARLLRHEQRDGVDYYELVHEYLVEEIWSWIGEQERELKKVQELLRQERDNWARFRSPIALDRLELINEYREELRPDALQEELLLWSALQHGYQVEYWLERLGRRKGEEILIAALRDGEEEARFQAAFRLWRLPTEEAIDALAAATLEDASPEVRATAAVGLWRASGPRFLEILTPELHGEDGERRNRALQALAHVQDAGGLDDWRPAIGLRLRVGYLLARIRWVRDAGQIWQLVRRSALGSGLGWCFGLFLTLYVDPIRANAALFGAVLGLIIGLLAGGGLGLGIGLAGSLWPRQVARARLVGGILGGIVSLVPTLAFLAYLTDQPAAKGAVEALLLTGAFALGLALPPLASRSRLVEVAGGTAGCVFGFVLAESLGLLNLGGTAISAAVGVLVGLGTTLGIVWGRAVPARVGSES